MGDKVIATLAFKETSSFQMLEVFWKKSILKKSKFDKGCIAC